MNTNSHVGIGKLRMVCKTANEIALREISGHTIKLSSEHQSTTSQDNLTDVPYDHEERGQTNADMQIRSKHVSSLRRKILDIFTVCSENNIRSSKTLI